MDRGAVGDRRRADHLPQILVGGDRLQGRQVPWNLGRVPRRRQEIEGQEPAVRPDRRPHLRRRTRLVVPLSVVVGRQGDRRRRQDRRAEQQGDDRVGQIRGRLVEGDNGRGRGRLGGL